MFVGHLTVAQRLRAAKSCTGKTIAKILGDFDGYGSDISDLEVHEYSSDEGDQSSDSDNAHAMSIRHKKYGYIGSYARTSVRAASRPKEKKYKVRKKVNKVIKEVSKSPASNMHPLQGTLHTPEKKCTVGHSEKW